MISRTESSFKSQLKIFKHFKLVKRSNPPRDLKFLQPSIYMCTTSDEIRLRSVKVLSFLTLYFKKGFSSGIVVCCHLIISYISLPE